MSIDYQINNISHNLAVHKKLMNLNIYYNHINSLYNFSIQDIEGYNFIDENVIDKYNIPYGITVINEPIKIIEQNTLYSNYSNKLLFFHGDISSNFKKEDIYLINNNISRYKKYSFIPNVANKFPEVEIIKYGFEPNAQNMYKDRNNDIIILYANDGRQAETLQHFIRSKHSNVRILNTKEINNKDTIISLLNTYKICIDINSYYNVLMSVSCGCYGLGAAFPENNSFVHNIQDFNLINDVIDKLLHDYNDAYINETQQYIIDNYDYETFKLKIKNIIDLNYKLPVTL
jgi:hypothetical protein